jgi:hypothetical protein
MMITDSASLPVPGESARQAHGGGRLSGHLGRVGGRQVVAVLALGGGLLLGPVLPAQSNEDGAAATGDTGPVTTAPEAAQDLGSAVTAPAGPRPEGAVHGGGRQPGRAASG